RDPMEERRFFYARIWQPGPEGELDYQFMPGTPVALPGTGIEISFSDFGLPGDFWIVAARPNTPELVVPWRLLDAAAPMGPQRFYAPLGLVHWTVDATGASATVEDCRHRFRKLCEVESCCTIHVGDGHSSHGEVDDLQAAIDLLPPAGGQICLLPGIHQAAGRIVERDNIVIQGCGPRSRVVAAAGQTDPVLAIEDSRDIVLRDFAISSETTVLIGALRPERLQLARMQLEARDRGAVIATAGDGVELVECAITILPLAAPLIGTGAPLEPAVFLAGDRLRVLRSRIVTQPGESTGLTALGGLQIGGDSIDVEIADNLIEAGNNAGLVLGSIEFVQPEVVGSPQTIQDHYAGHFSLPTYSSWLSISVDDCIDIDPRPGPQDDPDQPTPPVPISDGPVVDCRILRNRILDMGASGITVAFWFDPDREDDAIVTDRLRIDGNEIRGCMRLNLVTLPPELRQIVAFGGITLAAGAEITIRDNRIVELGTEHTTPIVGIFVLDGEAVAIQRNHARDNGRIADLDSNIEIGWAGGIIVSLARPGVDFFAPFGDQVHARQDGAPALIVENNVVVAREGRALCVIGVGPMVIHGNQLTAHGSNTLRQILIAGAVAGGFNVTTLALVGLLSRRQTRNPLMAYLDILGGAAVAVLNLGLSNEVYLQLLGFSGLGLVDPQQPPDGGFDDDIRLLANGNVQFNDNQVTFDSLSPAVTLTLSSVLLLSLDDISMQDNQCDCDLLVDFVGIHALAFGWSVRMHGNRLKEGFFNAFLSGMTVGVYNDTSHNQGTHCFLTIGRPRLTVVAVPSTNRHGIADSFCEPFLVQRDLVGQAAGFPVAQVGVG
ncbi:MAG: right-handed parallel beta-helix repeat-containing protein, partial [Geminicoccaceae bacterium]